MGQMHILGPVSNLFGLCICFPMCQWQESSEVAWAHSKQWTMPKSGEEVLAGKVE